MQRKAQFRIAGLPRTKGSLTPGMTKTGRMFVHRSRASVTWERQVKDVIKRQLTELPENAEFASLLLHAGPVKLEFQFYLPRFKTTERTEPIGRRDGDLDKLERNVVDAMTGVIYVDDAQVTHKHSWKGYSDGLLGHWIGVIVKVELLGDLIK
jgi:Holliday junction resolvase RusA-like endonuclease